MNICTSSKGPFAFLVSAKIFMFNLYLRKIIETRNIIVFNILLYNILCFV